MSEIIVKGMSCAHCVAAVAKAMESVAGVQEVQVDLASGRVTFTSDREIPREDLAQVIKAAGYELSQ